MTSPCQPDGLSTFVSHDWLRLGLLAELGLARQTPTIIIYFECREIGTPCPNITNAQIWKYTPHYSLK